MTSLPLGERTNERTNDETYIGSKNTHVSFYAVTTNGEEEFKKKEKKRNFRFLYQISLNESYITF